MRVPVCLLAHFPALQSPQSECRHRGAKCQVDMPVTASPLHDLAHPPPD
ncbi:hypothetical protein PF003_g12439 [Phytophthora fragariae]|nr:hypothetical protein PF003_g12439 [Phytophthora fragariae]